MPSQRRNRQETLLTNHVLELLPLAIAVIDAKPRLHYWNPRAAAFLGLPLLLAQEAPLLADILEATDSLSLQQRDRLLEFCSSQIAADDRAEPDTSLRLSLGRGNRIQVQLRALGAGRWMLIIDNCRTMPAGAHDTKDAWLDALTGLSNRRRFNEALTNLISGSGQRPDHALLMINLDRFKKVNDTFGYAVGDGLLCLIAQRLRREVPEDDLLARVDGDEFAVLLTKGGHAESMAARVMDIVTRPFLVGGHIVDITASIGIARFPEHGTAADDLMRHAERALCDAKTARRRTGRTVVPAMQGGRLPAERLGCRSRRPWQGPSDVSKFRTVRLVGQ